MMLGVNLGGWLLLERWITPSLFVGIDAKDEYTFCEKIAPTDYKRLRQHRNHFIANKDFEWLASRNVDTIRIPVGYWALEDREPFINCKEQLDRAFTWAEELGFKVLLDLHGAPGSQNGHDHSGRIGPIEWTKPKNISLTLDILGELSKRYGKHRSLWGVELINEPGWDVPLDLLREFYKDGYNRVRKHCGENVAVIISDAFRPLEWNGFMSDPEYKNVVLDVHLYQRFSPEDQALDMQGHLDKTHTEWARVMSHSDKPVIIGEWSLGLDPKTFKGMDEVQKQSALKAYGAAQQEVFAKAAGWFFWTYKTEDMPAWNYRHLVEAAILA